MQRGREAIFESILTDVANAYLTIQRRMIFSFAQKDNVIGKDDVLL